MNNIQPENPVNRSQYSSQSHNSLPLNNALNIPPLSNVPEAHIRDLNENCPYLSVVNTESHLPQDRIVYNETHAQNTFSQPCHLPQEKVDEIVNKVKKGKLYQAVQDTRQLLNEAGNHQQMSVQLYSVIGKTLVEQAPHLIPEPIHNVKSILFHTGIGLLFTHELDAMLNHEWRVLPITSWMKESPARNAFTYLHVPIFGALVAASSARNPVVRQRTQRYTSAFCIGHAVAHAIFQNHPQYTFSGVGSNSLIWGAAICGAAYLILDYLNPAGSSASLRRTSQR